jgi:hypothetical protein
VLVVVSYDLHKKSKGFAGHLEGFYTERKRSQLRGGRDASMFSKNRTANRSVAHLKVKER